MKAVVLFSGGLDSMLAAKVVKSFGIDVIALNFLTPFTGRTRGRKDNLPAGKSAENLGLEYKEVFLGDEYLAVVRNPVFGYGKNANPCIDCKIFFIKKAGEMMERMGASFLATGEVAGQRPMSQNKATLSAIAKRSGFGDLLLRPLSARLLPETIPEKEGWVDRKKLFALSGRIRTPQIELAKKLGISDYPNAGGGCLLTDREFAKRILDLMKYGELSLKDVELVKWGRYFRLDSGFKLAVGRDEKDNAQLESLAEDGDYLFSAADFTGPVGLGIGVLEEKAMADACGIVARYVSSEDSELKIKISGPVENSIRVKKAAEEDIARFRV